MHTELCKEAGARILLAFIARNAAQFNFLVVPFYRSLNHISIPCVAIFYKSVAGHYVIENQSGNYPSYCNQYNCTSTEYLNKGDAEL